AAPAITRMIPVTILLPVLMPALQISCLHPARSCSSVSVNHARPSRRPRIGYHRCVGRSPGFSRRRFLEVGGAAALAPVGRILPALPSPAAPPPGLAPLSHEDEQLLDEIARLSCCY